jgi:excisionase family DNA binding protein
MPIKPAAGYTVKDVARRYRVSPDKVRAWIARGELRAVNTSTRSGGKRWVITVESLEEFERRRDGSPLPRPRRQRRRESEEIDYFPND